MIVQFNLLAAPSSTISPFNAQRVAFCTRASEAVAQSIDGTNTVTPVIGWLSDSSVMASCSGDLSQGNGFFAEGIDGTVTIPDVNIAKAIAAGTLSVVGADVFIYDSRPLVQLRVAEVAFQDGDAIFTLKSRTYTMDGPLWAAKGVESGTTDPNDPTNPSDPAYFQTVQYTQFAGTVFGSREVSIKTADAPKSFTLARWAWSADQFGGTFRGAIATGNEYAKICSPYADAIDVSQIDDPSGAAIIDFYMLLDPYPITTHTERDRFYNEIAQLMSDGYSIIITDGNWFCDLSRIGISCVTKGFRPYVSLAARDADYVRVTIPNTQFPPWGADPASIKLIASKNSVAVATSQVELRGAAYNGKTVGLVGADSWDGLVQSFSPANSGADGIVSIAPVTPLNLCCVYPLPIQMTGLVGFQVDGAGAVANIVAGSTEDINTDPTTPYALGGSPISYGWHGTSVHTTADLRIGLISGLRSVDADFVFFDSSYRVSVAFGTSTPYSWGVRYSPPMQAAPEISEAAISGAPYSSYKPLQTSFNSIKWRAAQRSISDANAVASGLFVEPFPGTPHELSHAQVEVFDVTAYAVRKIGNANIYATVYPFWTSKDLNALDGDTIGGGVTAAGSGFGYFYGDSITWTKDDVRLDAIPGVLSIRGSSWGMVVGVASGATAKGFARYSSTDYDFSIWGSGFFPTKVRKLGSYFIVPMSNGTLASSLTGTSWTLPTGGNALYDAAFDGTTYVAVGNNRTVYASDPAALHSGTITGSPLLRAVVWVQPSGIYSSGGFFLAGGDGGKIYKATSTQAAAGAWTTLTPAFSEDIHELAASDNGIVAATPNGIWATHDCVTWKKVATVTPGAAVTSEPHRAAIVSIGGSWVYANGPQVLTSVDADPMASTATWKAWSSLTPTDALDRIRSQWMGGMASWNPIRWQSIPWYPNVDQFGIAFDPPGTISKVGEQVSGGSFASAALAQICREWWIFSGEMPSAALDGSADAIDLAIPSLRPGDAQDVATSATFQFAPFAGEYTGAAYIQNTDHAYSAGNDEFYFGGWPGGDGLTIWTEFRNAYLASGVNRPITRSFDSIHDSGTLSDLLLRSDADLGQRIKWICRAPRYIDVTVSGNSSAAALAFPGCRYKVNQTLLQARDMGISGTGYGVVVNCEHNYTKASHHLTVAFPPQ